MTLSAPYYIQPVQVYKPSLPVTVHRDQDQPRPLWGALEAGCEFIEMDVHLVEGEIVVGHDEGQSNRSFRAIYLDPLQQLAERGALEGQFSLLVDFKTEATSTFKALESILKDYASILTSFDGEMLHRRQVQIIITGNRDREAIKAQIPRTAFLDGRLEDFQSDIDPYLTPMISDKWSKILGRDSRLFQYSEVAQKYLCRRRRAPTYERDAAQIDSYLEQAQGYGIRFRAWAVPENFRLWGALAEKCSRHYVYNTDNPEQLCSFLSDSVDLMH